MKNAILPLGFMLCLCAVATPTMAQVEYAAAENTPIGQPNHVLQALLPIGPSIEMQPGNTDIEQDMAAMKALLHTGLALKPSQQVAIGHILAGYAMQVESLLVLVGADPFVNTTELWVKHHVTFATASRLIEDELTSGQRKQFRALIAESLLQQSMMDFGAHLAETANF